MAFNRDTERQLDIQRVEEHVEALAGKFDTVHVFVSRYDVTTGETAAVSMGTGNWYARKGQILDWIQQEEATDEWEESEEGWEE